MSKACEYAARVVAAKKAAAEVLEFKLERTKGTWVPDAFVTETGALAINANQFNARLEPGEALQFAAWILDTFGEADGAHERT